MNLYSSTFGLVFCSVGAKSGPSWSTKNNITEITENDSSDTNDIKKMST